jgi:hypothetical protein
MAFSPEAKRFARSILQDLETDAQDLLGYIQYRSLKELPNIQSHIASNVQDLETTKLCRRFMSFKGNKLVYGGDAFVLPSQFYPVDDGGHEILSLMNLATLSTWVLGLAKETEISYRELVNAIPHAFVNVTITSRYHWSSNYKLDVITMVFAKQCEEGNLSLQDAEAVLHDVFSVIEPTMEVQNRILLITELMHRSGPYAVPRLFTVERFLIRMAEFIKACCFLKGFPLAPDEREEGVEQEQNDTGREHNGNVEIPQVPPTLQVANSDSPQPPGGKESSVVYGVLGSPMPDAKVPGSPTAQLTSSQSIKNHRGAIEVETLENASPLLENLHSSAKWPLTKMTSSSSLFINSSPGTDHDSPRNKSELIKVLPNSDTIFSQTTKESSDVELAAPTGKGDSMSSPDRTRYLQILYPEEQTASKAKYSTPQPATKKTRKTTARKVKTFVDQHREEVLAQLAKSRKK